MGRFHLAAGSEPWAREGRLACAPLPKTAACKTKASRSRDRTQQPPRLRPGVKAARLGLLLNLTNLPPENYYYYSPYSLTKGKRCELTGANPDTRQKQEVEPSALRPGRWPEQMPRRPNRGAECPSLPHPSDFSEIKDRPHQARGWPEAGREGARRPPGAQGRGARAGFPRRSEVKRQASAQPGPRRLRPHPSSRLRLLSGLAEQGQRPGASGSSRGTWGSS